MIKRMLLMVVLVGSFSLVANSDANAWVVVRRRIAPVRRVLAPRYLVARPVVVGPVLYSRPVIYGPRVHVGVGYGYGYGW